MKTLYRQDGSAAELDDADAAKWLSMGLGTLTPPATADAPDAAVDADEPFADHADEHTS